MRMSHWPVASHDSDFDPYLVDRHDLKALFRRFTDMTRACGPVMFELQRPAFVLRGTRWIFGAITVTDRGLQGCLNLTRELTDRRMRKVDPVTKRLFMNRFLITSGSELDETFGQWLGEAREIGDGVADQRPVSPGRQRCGDARPVSVGYSQSRQVCRSWTDVAGMSPCGVQWMT